MSPIKSVLAATVFALGVLALVLGVSTAGSPTHAQLGTGESHQQHSIIVNQVDGWGL